ncbi:MAG: hypothetical protein K9I82_02500 [Chitinophagaceae bacterium]|nr:hypothetical protein [Chitinophagaceae bacterium]
MKKTFLLFFIILISCNVFSQSVPQKINYQAIARNSSGAIFANQNISLKAEILDSNQTFILYAETHSTTTNAFGLFSLQIGGGTLLSGKFSSINWGIGSKYLRTSIDINGGNNFTTMGTSPLLSVPYAQYAAKADTALYIKGVTDQYRRLQTQLYIKN